MELDKLRLKNDEKILIDIDSEIGLVIENINGKLKIFGPFNCTRKVIVVSYEGMHEVSEKD